MKESERYSQETSAKNEVYQKEEAYKYGDCLWTVVLKSFLFTAKHICQ